MSRIFIEDVLSALKELSDREVQRRLWLSDGSQGAEVSSFVEAVSRLYDDSGIGDSYEFKKTGTGLGIEVDQALGQLHRALKFIDDGEGPEATIEAAAMEEVREIASRLLGTLTVEQ